LAEGLDLSRATNSTQNVTLCLAAFARLAVMQGDPEQAARGLSPESGAAPAQELLEP
jgi:hypothetical protein